LSGTGNTQQYLYCNSHQLQGVYPTGATCANPGTATSSIQYAAWGNLTSRSYNSQTATLSYDPLDQLVEWQVPGTNQACYGYDSSGERSLQRSSIGSTTSITVYAFGLEEYHYDGSSNLQSSTHYYTLAGRLLGELQVNGSTQSTTYFLSDGLGSILGVFSNTATSASLLASQLYYPYGASRYGSGSISPYTNKGFTGQYNDPTSGLDYYGARYYDPVVGLFVSVDKKLGDMQGANPYAYVGENPETNTDPTGERFISPGGQEAPPGPISTDSPYATAPTTSLEQQAITYQNLLNPGTASNGLSLLLNAFLFDHTSWVQAESYAEYQLHSSLLYLLGMQAWLLIHDSGINWNFNDTTRHLFLRLNGLALAYAMAASGTTLDSAGMTDANLLVNDSETTLAAETNGTTDELCEQSSKWRSHSD